MQPITITAYTLRHLINCDRRVWLDHYGDRSQQQAIVSPYAVDGITHEDSISETTFGDVMPVPTTSWAEMVDTTQALMRRGVQGIRGAAFEKTLELSGQLVVARGRVDWLKRIPEPSQLGRWSYAPVEIKRRREYSEADLLQLDFYLWLVNSLQGSEAPGWLWMGRDLDGRPGETREHWLRSTALITALEQVVATLRSVDAPDIYLGSHCQPCPWYKACESEAQARRSIALLPGLTRTTWEALQQQEIITLDELLMLSEKALQAFHGIGKAKAREHLTYATAVVRNEPVQRDGLPELVKSPGIMLDLETCMEGDTGLPWCFGWQCAGEPFEVAIVDPYFNGDTLSLGDGIRAWMVPDSDTGWRKFAAAAERTTGPIYHWSGFERTMLRSSAPPDVVAALEHRFHDLNKSFKRSFVLPVRGTNIKKVASYFGFHWPEGTSAHTAWEDYNRWLLDGDGNALTRACAYNRADVVATDVVWQWMIGTSTG